MNGARRRGPAALYVAVAIGLILAVIGTWQAVIGGVPLLLLCAVTTLALAGLAIWFHRRAG